MQPPAFSFFFFFLLFLQLSSSLIPPQPYPYVNTSFHIDCGGSSTTVDPTSNTTWLSDRFFTGGSSAIVSEPLRFVLPHEKTLRYFPLSSGKKNCYIVPDLPSGRYYIRTFTAYDNYDGRSHSPSFDASVEGTLVFSWRSPWSEDAAQSGAYSDLLAYVIDGEADICFYSIATDVPVIGSLSIVRVDPLSYDFVSVGNRSILVNYGRLDCGSGQWGPGFTNDTDYFGRSWQSDSDFRSAFSETFIDTVTTQNSISGTNQQPNYFPMKLYQTAVTVSQGDLEYEFDVDAKVDYLLWFHFAEIDSNVNAQGKRVFDIVVNERNVTRIDIYKEVGLFAAYGWHYTVKNLSTNALRVKLVSVVGAPLISGLENYALVPADLSTDPQQVIAMRSLKEILQVPERMGWNGDPCAPTDWDAWEGISCRPNKDGSYLVIFQIDLASQGLKGSISDKIGLLTNLASLNLSSNSLEGSIPSGLGLKSLVQLDLSHNQLTGYIPDSLTSSGLQLVLLNDNLLEGPVPVELYSIGVHGGVVDVSGNKGLCGVQPLPSCSMLWDDGGISSGGRVAIGVSSVIGFTMVVVLMYVCYVRRRRSDYGFGFPQDLMAIAAKRNKYQRQKSLMVLELESQHAKGFPSPFIHAGYKRESRAKGTRNEGSIPDV